MKKAWIWIMSLVVLFAFAIPAIAQEKEKKESPPAIPSITLEQFKTITTPKTAKPDEINKTFNTNLALASPLKIEDLENSKDQILAKIANYETNIKVYEVDVSGKMSYLAAGISGEYSTVVYKQEFVGYSFNDAGQKLGFVISIEATIQSSKAGLDLGTLAAIGAALKGNEVSGNLSVHVHGLSGKLITLLTPTPDLVSEVSIKNVLQIVNTIKNTILDSNVNIVPQIIPPDPQLPIKETKKKSWF